MRLWSLNPAYLDAKGLVALWREGLLAQSVLRGNTQGYRRHPQLARFKMTRNPVGAMAVYLRYVLAEADRRGYHFDCRKIAGNRFRGKIQVTSGQVAYEYAHLLKKLKHRSPEWFRRLNQVSRIELHPSFEMIVGDVAPWEIVP